VLAGKRRDRQVALYVAQVVEQSDDETVDVPLFAVGHETRLILRGRVVGAGHADRDLARQPASARVIDEVVDVAQRALEPQPHDRLVLGRIQGIETDEKMVDAHAL
jgi:hypothetical protein